MEENGLDFNKGLGQNFLIDGNIVRKIADTAQITEADTVVEIGPGIGTLTEELLQRAGRVITIEIDQGFIPVLEENFKDYENFTLINGDALKLDYQRLLAVEAEGKKVKVVANLPYYITTPLISKILTEGLPISSATLMVQEEVADRIMASPSTKEYGSLTLYVQCFAEAKLALKAPKEVFLPQPKVDSSVIHMELKNPPEDIETEKLTQLIHGAFQQRRKTILNSISQAGQVDKKELREIFKDLGISPKDRAENLALEDYINIARALFN